MNISEFISDHVLKINSQTRNYWQRSVFMAQHTLIRKREQVFTLQGPLRGSSSALRACFAVSTWARGSSAGAHVCSSCPPKSLLQERAASISRVHRSPWGGGGGPQKEVESTFPVLRVQPSGPLLSPGEAAAEDHAPFRSGWAPFCGPWCLRGKIAPPCLSPLCSRRSLGSHHV